MKPVGSACHRAYTGARTRFLPYLLHIEGNSPRSKGNCVKAWSLPRPTRFDERIMRRCIIERMAKLSRFEYMCARVPTTHAPTKQFFAPLDCYYCLPVDGQNKHNQEWHLVSTYAPPFSCGCRWGVGEVTVGSLVERSHLLRTNFTKQEGEVE